MGFGAVAVGWGGPRRGLLGAGGVCCRNLPTPGPSLSGMGEEGAFFFLLPSLEGRGWGWVGFRELFGLRFGWPGGGFGGCLGLAGCAVATYPPPAPPFQGGEKGAAIQSRAGLGASTGSARTGRRNVIAL